MENVRLGWPLGSFHQPEPTSKHRVHNYLAPVFKRYQQKFAIRSDCLIDFACQFIFEVRNLDAMKY